MIPNSLNIFRWYDELQYQIHRQPYSYGQYHRLACSSSNLLPFQVWRETNGNAVTEFVLIDRETQSETDMLAILTAGGLAVTAFTGYDLITYPATLNFTTTLPEGLYYARMSDGVNTWYSEVFNMLADLSEFIKIEYYHGEEFNFPNGHIEYTWPYKSYFYIKSLLGKPAYRYENIVETRDGKNYAIQQISYKENHFEWQGTEFVMDAVRVIGQHDFVVITAQGREHEVDEIAFQEKWLRNGDVCMIVGTFRTDSVVVKNGHGVVGAYEPEPGECLDADYLAVAAITEGTAEHTGFYYLDSDGVTQVPFVDGDYIVVTGSPVAVVTLKQFSAPSTYLAVPDTTNQVTFDQLNDEYYFTTALGSLSQPAINSVNTAISPHKVLGSGFDGTFIEVWVEDINGVDHYAGFGTEAELSATGIEFNEALGNKVKIRTVTFNCPNIHETDYTIYELEGIGYWFVENDNIVQ